MDLMATQAREPDPETAEKATRRRFTPAYKLKILARTDHSSEGQIGAILREEGLYSSLLSTWRRQRDEGTLGALKPKKRGPKPKKDPAPEDVGGLLGEYGWAEREQVGSREYMARYVRPSGRDLSVSDLERFVHAGKR
jgi:transposase-like protein